MTKRDLISVAVKVYGIIMLAGMITSVPKSVDVFAMVLTGRFGGLTLKPWAFVAWTIFSILLWAAVGIVLIARGDKIAAALAREETQPLVIDFRRDAKDICALAVKVIGVYLVATAFVQFAQDCTHWAYDFAPKSGHSSSLGNLEVARDTVRQVWRANWVTIIKLAIQLAFGTAAMVGGGRIAAWLYPAAREPEQLTLGED